MFSRPKSQTDPSSNTYTAADSKGIRTSMKTLFPVILAAIVLTPIIAVAAAPQKPNILVIMADDLGYGDVSCYGTKALQTPHIDRLASEGLRFTSGYCSASMVVICLSREVRIHRMESLPSMT